MKWYHASWRTILKEGYFQLLLSVNARANRHHIHSCIAIYYIRRIYRKQMLCTKLDESTAILNAIQYIQETMTKLFIATQNNWGFSEHIHVSYDNNDDFRNFIGLLSSSSVVCLEMPYDPVTFLFPSWEVFTSFVVP